MTREYKLNVDQPVTFDESYNDDQTSDSESHCHEARSKAYWGVLKANRDSDVAGSNSCEPLYDAENGAANIDLSPVSCDAGVEGFEPMPGLECTEVLQSYPIAEPVEDTAGGVVDLSQALSSDQPKIEEPQDKSPESKSNVEPSTADAFTDIELLATLDFEGELETEKTPELEPATGEKQLSNLQQFLLQRMDKMSETDINKQLLKSTTTQLIELIDNLDVDRRKKFELIRSNPIRLLQLANAELKEKGKIAVKEALKSGAIDEKTAQAFQQALGKDLLPKEVIMLMLKGEMKSGKFDLCTKSVYTSLIESVERDMRKQVTRKEFGLQERSEKDGSPLWKRRIDLTSGASPKSASDADAYYLGLGSSHVPDEKALSELGKLFERTQAMRGDSKNAKAEREFQTIIGDKIKLVNDRALFVSILSETTATIKRQFNSGELPESLKQELMVAQKEDKFDQKVLELAQKYVVGRIESILSQQEKLGLITLQERNRLAELAKEGSLLGTTAAAMIREESAAGEVGIVSRASARTLESQYNTKYWSYRNSAKTNNGGAVKLMVPEKGEKEKFVAPEKTGESKVAGPDKSSEGKSGVPGKADERKVDMPDKPISLSAKSQGKALDADTITGAVESMKKLDAWLESVGEKRDARIDGLHKLIVPLSHVVDQKLVWKHYQESLKADVKVRYQSKVGLDQMVLSELESMEKSSNKAGFESKISEIAEGELKKVLKLELQQQRDNGVLSFGEFESEAKKIADGEPPESLFDSMLSKEQSKNEFGSATRAFYGALVEKYNVEAPQNYLALRRAGLDVPPGFLAGGMLDDSGRIMSPDRIASMFAFSLHQKIGTGLLKIDTSKVPDDTTELFQLARWNKGASAILLAHFHKVECERLDKAIVKIGRPEWKREGSMPVEDWLARVGPMVDLTMEIKFAVQAMVLSESLRAGRGPSQDEYDALRKNFPGKIEFKGSEVTSVQLDLPEKLTPSFESSEKLRKIKEWFKANEARATQAMEALANAALNEKLILVWQEQPLDNGKVMKDGKVQDCNLLRNRLRVENVTDSDGNKKVRIHSFNEFCYSELWNLYDIGAREVDVRPALILAGPSAVEKALEGKVKREALLPLYRQLKEAEDSFNKQSEASTENKNIIATMTDILKKAGVTDAEAVCAKIFTSYTDYNETDMVCILNGGKVQMMLAKEVQSWRSGEQLKEIGCKGLVIAMDVGMFAIGLGELVAAYRVAQAVKAVSCAVMRQAYSQAIQQLIKQAVKNFALSLSGALLSNARTQSAQEGRWLREARDLVFVGDGVVSLAKGGRGVLNRFGMFKPSPQAQATGAVMNQFKRPFGYGSYALETWNLGCQVVVGTQLSTHLAERAGKKKLPHGLKYGNETLLGLLNDGTNGSRLIGDGTKYDAAGNAPERFFADLGKTIAGKDFYAAQRLADHESQILKQLQTGKGVSNDLLKRYFNATDDGEKVFLALGLLKLAQKPDGTLTNDLGRFGVVDVTSELLMTEVKKGFANGSAERKMQIGRALVAMDLMNWPEYSTVCRDVLKDAKSSSEAKTDALLDLALCIKFIGQQSPNDPKAAFQSFGCSPEELKGVLRKTAESETDPNVRGMAVGLAHAFSLNDPAKTAQLVDKCAADWRMIKLNNEIKDLEQRAKEATFFEIKDKVTDAVSSFINRSEAGSNSDVVNPFETQRKMLASRLFDAREELADLRESLAIEDNPALSGELANSQKSSDGAKGPELFSLLEELGKLQNLKAELKTAGHCHPDPESVEKKIAELTVAIKAAEVRLGAPDRGFKVDLNASQLPAIPQSLSKTVGKRLVAELSTNDSDSVTIARTKLNAIDALDLLKEQDCALSDREYVDKIVDLIRMDNGVVATEALQKLLARGINSLTPEQQKQIQRELLYVLKRNHAIDPALQSTHPDEAKRSADESVSAKIELMEMLKALLDTKVFSPAVNEQFIDEIVKLIDPSDANYAASHPSLREAAAKALGSLKAQMSDLPVDKMQKIFKVLHDTMRPYSPAKNNALATGEPETDVRRAAYHTAKLLEDRDLKECAKEFKDSEKDPLLRSKYATEELSTLRPDRPECALRIFEKETDHWIRVAFHSAVQPADAALQKYMLNAKVHPDSLKDSQKQLRKDLATASKQFVFEPDPFAINPRANFALHSQIWFGSNPFQKEYDTAVAKAYKDDTKRVDDAWNQVKADAALGGETGQTAKAALLWMVSHAGLYDLRAAKAIRELLTKEIPDKELFFFGFSEAYRGDTHSIIPDNVRTELLEGLNELAEQDKSGSMKEWIGRIATDALEFELKQPSTPGVVSASDKRKITLIGLLNKCEYALGLSKVKSLQASVGGRYVYHESVRQAGLEFERALNERTPKSPGSEKACADLLKTAVDGRKLFQKRVDEKNAPIAAPVPKEPGEADDKLSALERRRLEYKRLSDDGKAIDSVTARRAINDACCSQPITSTKDLRIPHLQILLKDENNSIALSVAWHLVKAADPALTRDENHRKLIRSQAFYKDAIGKLQELEKDKKSDPETASDATRLLAIVKDWDSNNIVDSTSSKKVFADKTVSNAFETLDPLKSKAPVSQKCEAIELLVLIASREFNAGKPELQQEVESLMRQLSSTRDGQLGIAIADAVRKTQSENPYTESIDLRGRRVLNFKNGTKTVITEGPDHCKIEYPDGSWMKCTMDGVGSIDKYEDSRHPGVEKLAGRDFTRGSIRISRSTGAIIEDDAANVRSVRLASGESWSYFRGDVKAGEALCKLAKDGAGLQSASIKDSVDGCQFDSDVIRDPGDLRLKEFNVMLAKSEPMSDSERQKKFAAARAIIGAKAGAIEPSIYAEAKAVFLQEELKGTFLKDAPVEQILSEMNDAAVFFGRIKDGDQRRKMFVEALESKEPRIRTLAAKIIAYDKNSAFTDKDRLGALKVVISDATLVDSVNNDDRKVGDLHSIINELSATLGNVEANLDATRSVKIESGKLTKLTVNYADGSVDCLFDERGIYRTDFKIGKRVLLGDNQNSDGDKSRCTLFRWMNAGSAKDALKNALEVNDERINICALTAKSSAGGEEKYVAIDMLIEKALTLTAGVGRSGACRRLDNLLHTLSDDDQVHIYRSWRAAYDKSDKRGVSPYQIPAVTLDKYTFPPNSTYEAKVDHLFFGVGWMSDFSPSTQSAADDAALFTQLERSGAGRNNYRDLCTAIIKSDKSQAICKHDDPRRFVIRRLANSDNDRVALASLYMLVNSQIASDFEAGCEGLAMLAMRRGSPVAQAEAKAILTGIIRTGGDEQSKAAHKQWTRAWEACGQRANDGPPAVTLADDVRRYYANADKEALTVLFSQSPEVRKSLILAMRRLDSPGKKYLEVQLDQDTRPAATKQPTQFLTMHVPRYQTQELMNFTGDYFLSLDPKATKRRADRRDADSGDEALGWKVMTKEDFDKLKFSKVESQPKKEKLDILKLELDPVKDKDSSGSSLRHPRHESEKPQPAERFQRRDSQWNDIVVIPKAGDKRVQWLGEQLVAEKKTDSTSKRIWDFGVTSDEDAVKFSKSVPPEVMAEFCRELMFYRPDIAGQQYIDEIELATLLRNWIVQKSAGLVGGKSWINNVTDYDYAGMEPVDPFRLPVRSYNRGQIPSYGTEKLLYDKARSDKLNQVLADCLKLKEPVPGLLKWSPRPKAVIETPNLVEHPPLELLDAYKTDVTKLLPAELRNGSPQGRMVAVKDLLELGAEKKDAEEKDTGKGNLGTDQQPESKQRTQRPRTFSTRGAYRATGDSSRDRNSEAQLNIEEKCQDILKTIRAQQDAMSR
ncbi:MAG: hypothetical protein K2X93_04035 [Candidatus Obscuribacterales bacterium]|nr:hypothetical protein [Candidatus Obscuribacterales bacterium]